MNDSYAAILGVATNHQALVDGIIVIGSSAALFSAIVYGAGVLVRRFNIGG